MESPGGTGRGSKAGDFEEGVIACEGSCVSISDEQTRWQRSIHRVLVDLQETGRIGRKDVEKRSSA